MIQLQAKTLNGKFIEYTDKILEGGYKMSPEYKIAYMQFIVAMYEKKSGIILSGNTGCGKTFLFEVMRRILHNQTSIHFTKVSVLDVVRDFNVAGHEIFERWKDKNVMFDDLGTESKGMYYGDKIEVFEKFIQFRYNLFHQGVITHFTTNLLPDEISNRYGARCMSRLNEMCATIYLPDQDFRKEKNFKGFVQVYHKKVETKEDREWKESYREFCKEHEGKPYVHNTGGGTGTVLRKMVEEMEEKGRQRIKE